jgi:hypothetical protein
MIMGGQRGKDAYNGIASRRAIFGPPEFLRSSSLYQHSFDQGRMNHASPPELADIVIDINTTSHRYASGSLLRVICIQL